MMKVLVIGHPQAVLGFSLVGVHGTPVSKDATPDEVNAVLDSALTAEGVGIVLVTQDVSKLITPRMDELKQHSTIPLVVEIPGPEGVSADQPSLSDVVLRAIGVKI
jgi:vacuolar-type H+-ATPase subunit F/Vma7